LKGLGREGGGAVVDRAVRLCIPLMVSGTDGIRRLFPEILISESVCKHSPVGGPNTTLLKTVSQAAAFSSNASSFACGAICFSPGWAAGWSRQECATGRAKQATGAKRVS
jgi:hypothetical protein